MQIQSFTSSSSPETAAPRVAALRRAMQNSELDGYIVPHSDEYLGEYLPPSAERLRWLTSFTGSAGTAVVLRDKAALFVDGRYTTQAAHQVDGGVFTVLETPEARLTAWLGDHLPRSEPPHRVGFDPALHSVSDVRRLDKAMQAAGIKLIGIAKNLVDAIWSDRPAPPSAKVWLHPVTLAGRPAGEKLTALAQALDASGADATLVAQSDAVAWLFNMRGGDIAHTPVALATALVEKNGAATLAIAREKLPDDVHAALTQHARIVEPEALSAALQALGARKATVRIAPEATPAAHVRTIEDAGGVIVNGDDLVADARAIKAPAEIEGSRQAHIRDGVAVTRFLAWLDVQTAKGGVDEISAAVALESFRAETGELRDLSFDTISGAGPNGAIVHYRVTEETNRTLKSGELYLCDSGAQYVDGTTDITRTIAIGTPSTAMRRHFTLVLKGHIAIATARFPEGTRGVDIDPFARRALWLAGLDYAHGTGHGIGSFLSVHEGPPGISRRNTTALKPGMIVSNEPGYYRPGHYGIRIENLVLVQQAEEIADGDQAMLWFETLTLAPIDRRLIAIELLSPDEITWLDAYHVRVRETLSERLGGETKTWLAAATVALV